jgi:hypothetical protein
MVYLLEGGDLIMIFYTNQKDHWYEHYMVLASEEQYDMIMLMFDQAPSDDELLNDDFGTITVELKSRLVVAKKYDEAINFIEKIKKVTTKFYQKEFPYLSNFAVEYYLYKGDWEKAQFHLQPFIDNPHSGYDLFIPLYDKVRFYQKNDLALSIAQAMYEPIFNSNDLINGAENELVDMIFYDLFQEHFIALELGQEPSLQHMKAVLITYDYNNDFFEVELPRIHELLNKISKKNELSIFTKDEWIMAVQADPIHAFRDLYWSFAIYMLKKVGFHFSISQDIWFTFSQILMKNNSLEFNFQRQDLENELANKIGLLSNEEEKGIAILWGIPYIYDFLDHRQLVNNEIKNQALIHVKAVKNLLIDTFQNEIWRFDFVHTWQKPESITAEEFTDEKEIFQRSFITPP